MAGKVRIGAELFCAADLRQALDAARQDGLDFACSPLSHPRNARDARGVSERREAPETRSDLALTCGEWSRLIVGTFSGWIRVYHIFSNREEYTQFLACGAELERADPEAWNGGHALRLREKAAALGVDTGRLPALPDLKYRAEWVGWEDWLGPGADS